MAAISQYPQYEQIADIMREMKRSAQDLLGEAPLTPLTDSFRGRTPNASHHQGSPWATPPHSSSNSPLEYPPAPSVLAQPDSNGNSSVANHSIDTERAFAIARSYHSPSEFLDGGMVSDHLPPSPDTRTHNSSGNIDEPRQPHLFAKPGADAKPQPTLPLKSVPPVNDRAVDALKTSDVLDSRSPSNIPSEDVTKKIVSSTRDGNVKQKQDGWDRDHNRNAGRDKNPTKHSNRERIVDQEPDHNDDGDSIHERERGQESVRSKNDRNRHRNRNRTQRRNRDLRRDHDDTDRDSDHDRNRYRSHDYNRTHNRNRVRDRNRGSDVDYDDNRSQRNDKKKDYDYGRMQDHERTRSQEKNREHDCDRNRKNESHGSEYDRETEENRGYHRNDQRHRDREQYQKMRRGEDHPRKRERDCEIERGTGRASNSHEGREHGKEHQKSRDRTHDPQSKSYDAKKERDYHRDSDHRRGREHRNDQRCRGSNKQEAKADVMSDFDASSQDSMESNIANPSLSGTPSSKKRRRSERPSTSKHHSAIATGSPPKKTRGSSNDKASGPGPKEGGERTVQRVVLRIPSKHVNNAEKTSNSSKSRDRVESSLEERSEKKNFTSTHKNIPNEEESRGSKRRAEPDLWDDSEAIEKKGEDGRRPLKRGRHDGGRPALKNVDKKDTASQGLRSGRPNKENEEAHEKDDSSLRTDLSKKNNSMDRHGKGSSFSKKHGSREGRVSLRSERPSTFQTTPQHPPVQDQEQGCGQDRAYGNDKAKERSRDRDHNRDRDHDRDLSKDDREKTGAKNPERRGHEVERFPEFQIRGGRESARDNLPSDHSDKKASKKSGDQERNRYRDRDVDEKVESARDSTVRGSEQIGRDQGKNGKPNDAGEKKPRFMGIRSKPVNFAQTGQGKVPASKSSVSPIDSMISGGVRKLETNASPVISTGTSSGKGVGSSSIGARSQHASRPSVQAKKMEMYDSYKKAKERCANLLEKKNYDLYEVAAKDCVRFYFEWALSLETELRLSEAEVRQGNGNEHITRRKHVTGVYRHMTNYLIPLRIRELEGIDRHHSTHYYSRLRQKVYMRLFYLQRVWNRDVRSGADALCKMVSDACKEKQAGDKVSLTLEYKQVTEIRDTLVQYQNNINIAEQIVSDNGDGHEEAGSECAIC